MLYAQLFPAEGSTLHYRIVGCSFPAIPAAKSCTVQVAAGYYNSPDSFRRHIIISRAVDTNRVIIEVPAFGKQYTWRVLYKNNTGAAIKTPLYHFSTGTVPEVDTNIYRIRITKPAGKYKGAFIFIDAFGVLYDMHGRPVWYLPGAYGTYPPIIRDLKLSPFATITFLDGPTVNEIDYNGNVLWHKPGSNNNNLDSFYLPYHHEFTRLTNGHYMVMATENVLCRLPDTSGSAFTVIDDKNLKQDSNAAYKEFQFGTLVEYDEKGNLVWKWRSSKYFEQSDLVNFYQPNRRTDLHDNAFYFDGQNKTAYISFRDVSRVVKVKYPEGNVLNEYGRKFNKSTSPPEPAETGNEFFCAQHACRRSQHGYLYLFDNGCDSTVPPRVIMMREPPTGQGQLEKTWEFECPVNKQDIYPGYLQHSGTGNVIELPDRSLFVSTGSVLAKVFIVSPDKEIVWSAISETRDQNGKTWRIRPTYRASIITTRKDLEQLIWNSEKQMPPAQQ